MRNLPFIIKETSDVKSVNELHKRMKLPYRPLTNSDGLVTNNNEKSIVTIAVIDSEKVKRK